MLQGGGKYGMLTVLAYMGKDRHYQHIYKCKCDCGKEVIRTEKTLTNEQALHSCGCQTKKNLIPGDKARCTKAGKARAIARNINGMNLDMTLRPGTISTNTSGVQGVSWSKGMRRWHTYVGYKSHRYTLGYYDTISEAKMIREEAEKCIKEGTFEEFFRNLK